MKELMVSPYFGVALSIVAFWIGVKLNHKLKTPVCNPLIVAIVLIVGVLLVFDIPYDTYNVGGELINMFLAPATACLAVAIYTKLDILKQYWLPILVGCTAGSAASMGSVYGMCRLFGLDESMTVSLLPKSVTTPIAVSISEPGGGVVPITVVAVIFTGILGSIIAPFLIRLFHVSDPVAAGLAIAVVTTMIGKIITNSITEPVKQIDAAVASLRKGELSNVEMLTYESEDELGDTIKNLKEAMGILADYVSEISMEVKAIAQGDLTRNGNDITDFLGDFSELKVSLLYILKRFNSTLTEISNLAEQVASNASEVENASKSLADGATEQAGVIEELNATVDTVVDMAEDTAKETQNASARVKASANKANEEKEKMNELLTEMEHITEISKEIGNIITDIEDIASQTNLLSLNASIEAARAGEAGKGFAVVADQIGKLAADSAKSAVNTRDLIDKTLVEIENGNTITRTTADAFNQIIADMESFAEIAQNTMEKANSQAESLEQIGQGIEQLSGVVQGNAASSEENTAISINLAEGAAKMHDRVNIFKLF